MEKEEILDYLNFFYSKEFKFSRKKKYLKILKILKYKKKKLFFCKYCKELIFKNFKLEFLKKFFYIICYCKKKIKYTKKFKNKFILSWCFDSN